MPRRCYPGNRGNPTPYAGFSHSLSNWTSFCLPRQRDSSNETPDLLSLFSTEYRRRGDHRIGVGIWPGRATRCRRLFKFRRDFSNTNSCRQFSGWTAALSYHSSAGCLKAKATDSRSRRSPRRWSSFRSYPGWALCAETCGCRASRVPGHLPNGTIASRTRELTLSWSLHGWPTRVLPAV